jgi:hypothetical protein
VPSVDADSLAYRLKPAFPRNRLLSFVTKSRFAASYRPTAMPRFSILSTIALMLLAAIFVACAAQPGMAQQCVVVELFTSEGCSSCPPADALLTQLSKQRNTTKIELILLGEHVDYWNGQGWNDRFSAPSFTQRQYEYAQHFHLASPYTPQVVIDGRLQATGGNAPGLQRMIAESARTSKSAVVSLDFVATDQLQVKVADSSNAKQRVLLAVTEDNLTTKVGGGENDGRLLVHNAVVRELRSLGTLSKGRFEKTVSVAGRPDWKRHDLRVIVLVQDESDNAIRGAASVLFSSYAEQAAR